MAFAVTPTSGSGPYTFTAEFDNSYLFGNGYRLEIRWTNEIGSCPVDAVTGARVTTLENQLVADGSAVSSTEVTSGQCRAYSASVITDDEVILQTETVFISNVATP